MLEITALNNERMRAALELLKAKSERVTATGAQILLDPTDVNEVLLVAGMNEKELEVI